MFLLAYTVRRYPPFALVPIIDGILLYLILVIYSLLFRSLAEARRQWEFGGFIAFGIAFTSLSFLFGILVLVLLFLVLGSFVGEEAIFYSTFAVLFLWRLVWVRCISSFPWGHVFVVTVIQGAIIVPVGWYMFWHM